MFALCMATDCECHVKITSSAMLEVCILATSCSLKVAIIEWLSFHDRNGPWLSANWLGRRMSRRGPHHFYRVSVPGSCLHAPLQVASPAHTTPPYPLLLGMWTSWTQCVSNIGNMRTNFLLSRFCIQGFVSDTTEGFARYVGRFSRIHFLGI